VTQRLQARGLPIRIGTPSSQPPFDWDDQATWAPALRNIDAVYLTYYPDLASPGAAERVGAFADLAVATGARRLVLLSGRGEEGARAGEQAVRASGADWTIIRSAFMAQNFNEGFFLEPVRAGEVAFPAAPDLAEPFIDADDIAAAAGRPIRYLPVSLEEYASLLLENQVPADYVKMLTEVFTEVLDGHNAWLGDGVRRALGRPPRDFADYARAAAATGVWSDPAAA
jgi:hypothetical protein